MIAVLRGSIAEKTPSRVIVDVAGVGGGSDRRGRATRKHPQAPASTRKGTENELLFCS